MARVPVGGDVEPGWEPVLQEFTRNFGRRGDVGAAVAVFRHGRPIVDLWGGLRDAANGLPWKRDTLVPVFSTTKGVAALVLASLRSRGHLDYDAPMATYWPEFAQHGKDKLTVRQLLAHEAGLAVLDRPVQRSDLFDLDALAAVLAEQRPAWPPGTRHGYHAVTLGLFQNELVRRTDPERRTLGQVLAEDLARPLGLAFFIGLPERIDMDRVAVLGRLARPDVLRQLPGVPWALARQLANRRSATAQSLRTPNLGAAERFSRREVLAPEVASTNGVGDARSPCTAPRRLAWRRCRSTPPRWPNSPNRPATRCRPTSCSGSGARSRSGSASRCPTSPSARPGVGRSARAVTAARSRLPTRSPVSATRTSPIDWASDWMTTRGRSPCAAPSTAARRPAEGWTTPRWIAELRAATPPAVTPRRPRSRHGCRTAAWTAAGTAPPRC